jgi:hypothetical protein
MHLAREKLTKRIITRKMPDIIDAKAEELESALSPNDGSFHHPQPESQANVDAKEAPERLKIKMEKPEEKPTDVTLPEEDISFSSDDKRDSSPVQVRPRKDSRRIAIGIGLLSIIILVAILGVVLTTSSKVSDTEDYSRSIGGYTFTQDTGPHVSRLMLIRGIGNHHRCFRLCNPKERQFF